LLELFFLLLGIVQFVQLVAQHEEIPQNRNTRP
jgi:hypothetical protein